MIDHGLPAS
jgi:hypothetical protein